jgi:hypothetical protein
MSVEYVTPVWVAAGGSVPAAFWADAVRASANTPARSGVNGGFMVILIISFATSI